MTSLIPVIEPNPNRTEQLAFRGANSLFGRQRRSRCASSPSDPSGTFVVPTRVAVGPGATLDDIEAHHKWAVEWSERIQLASEPRPAPLEHMSPGASALPDGSPRVPERRIACTTANDEIHREAGVQHWRKSHSALPELSTAQSTAGNRPLAFDTASTRPSGPRTLFWITAIAAMVLLSAVVGFMMMELPFSRSWDQQAGDNSVGLASSSSMRMNNLGRAAELTPRLIAHESRGISGQPVRLGLTLAGSAEGGVVLIAGVVPGMSFSSGSPAGADKWQVPATDLANTWIGPPQNFVGVAKLIAELQLPDGTIAHRVSFNAEWITATAGSELGDKATQGASDAPSPEHMTQSQCDYRGCASAYRSFRASDCTYQPRRGRRRLCEKGG